MPHIPPDIVTCFNKMVPAPARGRAMTAGDVVRLVAKLKASEDAKSQCGKRLIKFYETQRR